MATDQLQEMTDKIVADAVKREARRLSLASMIQEAYCRHVILGHGKKRISDFIDKSDEILKDLFKRYEDSDLFFMESYLKEQVGIDIRAIMEERWSSEDGV